MSIPNHHRFEGLQQLRFFAAFAVLVHHILEEMSASPLVHFSHAVERVGACGVDIFFVISGLVMWHTTRGFSSGTSANRFFLRRISRIMPPYWACLALIITLWGTGLLFKSMSLSGSQLIQAAFLLPPTTSSGMVLGVSWTLVYELYFYTICTAALLFPWEKYRMLLIPALLAVIPVVLNVAGASAQGDYYGNPIVVEFLFGLFLGWAAPRLPKLRARWLVLAACTGLFYWASMASPDEATYGLPASFRWWGWGGPALLTVAAVALTDEIGGTAGRVLTSLGDSSYMLYLTHGFLMIAFAKVIKSGVVHSAPGLFVAAAGVACLAIALGHGVHVSMERPMLAWFQRRRPRIRSSAVT